LCRSGDCVFAHGEGVRIAPKKTRNFNELLMEAIDEALSSLGESVKQSIYFHIENKFVPRNEIPENIKDFQGGLEKIFGAGAHFIEILIMKNLHAKIGITITIEATDKQLEFAKYVDAAKQSFLGKLPETESAK
jgi:hypothetical protein